jgi:DNA-binding MurR/RpiR family transcriptional regulator
LYHTIRRNATFVPYLAFLQRSFHNGPLITGRISVQDIDNGNHFCYTGAVSTIVDKADKRRPGRILLRLKRMLPQLPEQERKVGDYVLTHPHEVVGLSITRLAEVSGASTTTVSRFCRRLGTGGYRQFRIALAKEWDSPHNLIYVEVQADDTLASVTQKIFAANIQALRDMQGSLNLDDLQRVVDAILRAGRVDIYATGGAGIVARELHFKCMQLGVNANAFLDSQMQVMSAASLTPQDVGIGISHTGLQHHVAEALTLANAAGAKTIALTSYAGTPVAEAAGILLCTTSLAAAIAYDSPTVRTAQLAVVDVIYEAMLLEGRESARENMARVAQAIAGQVRRADHSAGSSPTS